METTVILEKLNELGVKTTVRDGQLRLSPASRIPLDLVEEIRTHKQVLILAIRPPEALKHALTQKNEEIHTMRKRLASEYYADDVPYQTWGEDVLSCLQGHIREIQRYLREGGRLTLPPCCKEEGHICLIAMRRFNACLMTPGECGFSLKDDDGKAQEALCLQEDTRRPCPNSP
jgi:hypothetical protein